MAAPNVTGDGQQKTLVDLSCSPNLSGRLHSHLTFLSVLNSFLSVTAFLGNAVTLIALRNESSLHPSSKLLLRCLATSDLCVGVIAEALTVTGVWMSVVKDNWSILSPRIRYRSYYKLCFLLNSNSIWTSGTLVMSLWLG